MELVEPILIPANEAKKVRPQSSFRGQLELKVTIGGPIYLFRGEKSADEAIRAVSVADNLDFALGATVFEHGRINVEENLGIITVFAAIDSVGYIRYCEKR